jgi:putative alpha-1,2-mannosidase
MTVTNHTALYRFTFPDTASAETSPLILLDLTDLSDSRSLGNVSVDAESGRILASGVFAPSFGIGTYTVYACADFSGAQVRDTGIFVNNRAGNVTKSYSIVQDGGNVSPTILPAGAYVQFEAPSENDQILARVGLSFISTSQACSNAEKEISAFDFEKIGKAAEDVWHEKLSVLDIDATGANKSLQTVFWSGIYRSMLSPQDYTGENPLWDSTEPYYDSYYCIWDSFRSIHQLITILDPNSQTQMIRSLIDIYRHEGKLPDCRMSLCKGNTQGGSNADIVLADSYLKNIRAGVDWATAYEAMISDAEVEPSNWQVEGRGGLESWKSLHYIPTDDRDFNGSGLFTRSISRTVEYAYDDWCIAQVAKDLGHMNDYEKYLGRSGYWKNMYNPTQTSSARRSLTSFLAISTLMGMRLMKEVHGSTHSLCPKTWLHWSQLWVALINSSSVSISFTSQA